MSYPITLKNFLHGKVTRKQYANSVKRKLLKQGQRSMTAERFGCLYRGDDSNLTRNGTACAIGLTITDQQFKQCESLIPTSNFMDIRTLIARNYHVFEVEGVSYDDYYFLKSIQLIHDQANDTRFAQDIKTGFKVLYNEWKLI